MHCGEHRSAGVGWPKQAGFNGTAPGRGRGDAKPLARSKATQKGLQWGRGNYPAEIEGRSLFVRDCLSGVRAGRTNGLLPDAAFDFMRAA
jgi:hypothetical protein